MFFFMGNYERSPYQPVQSLSMSTVLTNICDIVAANRRLKATISVHNFSALGQTLSYTRYEGIKLQLGRNIR